MPANQAATAQPIRAEETAKPVRPAPSENSAERALTAPLMTEVSKPNRKPPTAAATLITMTFGFNRWDCSGPVPDLAAGVDMTGRLLAEEVRAATVSRRLP